MDAKKTNISNQDRNSILNYIINCANCALQSEDVFQKAMFGLAQKLRSVFDSEYCSIGIVIDEYAEDCFISYNKFDSDSLSDQQRKSLESVKRVSINDDSYTVSLALKSEDHAWFKEEKMDAFVNYSYYKNILRSEVKNSCVIPIRDKDNRNYGFIQLINTKKPIDYDRDILPFNDAFIGLVQVVIKYQKIKNERSNRLKDADFYSLMQNKRNNVDELLDSIMEYFSEEFNAAIVSFRIPILNGYRREPIFYLRRVYVHQFIKDRDVIINHYYSQRPIKTKDEIRVVRELRCDNQGMIFESRSDTDFSQYDLDLDNNTLIMPICQDTDRKCIHPQKNASAYCKENDHYICIEKFKRYYGFFRLRISKIDLKNVHNHYYTDYELIKERLSYLSKQITLLINTIVNKNENVLLRIFQDGLKQSSFIKIHEFDAQCAKLIKESVHSKVCSIYRFDDRTRLLTLSATTAKTIRFKVSNTDLYFEPESIKDSCFIHIKAHNNILSSTFNRRRCVYVYNIKDNKIHESPYLEYQKNICDIETAIAIPMLKKDESCAGIILLIGKEENKHSISTSFWEHDINAIEFIVKVLTRISESDTERLTFLSQLAHELLAPVTELVYDNDLTINIAERNHESFSKRQLISKIRENINRILLFKYIIYDTEFIYSSGKRSIDYNIVKQERPQDILLNAIRLMEKDAHSKGLSIRTNISDMPPLYFDKERMMQVFLNLIKNAIKYSDNYTTINIYYKNDGVFHEIRFANYGIGIQEEEKNAIFELFYRGEEAKKKIIRGTGMGLYIVRDIMKAHRGMCYVRHLNNPTEVVITLPYRK